MKIINLTDEKQEAVLKLLKLDKEFAPLSALKEYLEYVSFCTPLLLQQTVQENKEMLDGLMDRLNKLDKPKGYKVKFERLKRELKALRTAFDDEELELDEDELVIYQTQPILNDVKEKLKSYEEVKQFLSTQEDIPQDIVDKLAGTKNLYEGMKVAEICDTRFKDAVKQVKENTFVLTKTSVIPVLPLGVKYKDNLDESCGFRIEHYFGYPVIADQMLIGINKSLIGSSEGWGSKEGSKKKKKETVAVKQVVQDIIDSLSTKSNQQFVLVHHAPFCSDKCGGNHIDWYWINTQKNLNRFANIFTNNNRQRLSSIRIIKWGPTL